jgi:hypothetical protein
MIEACDVILNKINPRNQMKYKATTKLYYMRSPEKCDIAKRWNVKRETRIPTEL